MESDLSWEQNTLINELIQGMEVARKLKADLKLPYSVDTRDLLLQRILSSYEKALLILRCSNASTSELQGMNQATPTLLPESPLSVHGSPLREDVHGAIKDHHNSKKRWILLNRLGSCFLAHKHQLCLVTGYTIAPNLYLCFFFNCFQKDNAQMDGSCKSELWEWSWRTTWRWLQLEKIWSERHPWSQISQVRELSSILL